MKKRYLLLAIIVLSIVLLLVLRFTEPGQELSTERIFSERDRLLRYVENHFLTGILLFIIAYISIVALSIPGATVMSILGGFLFGPVAGTLAINIGASSGALILFLLARFFFGQAIQQRYEQHLEKFNREFKHNGISYLLSIRLIPIFPFFLINLLAGFTRVKPLSFLWTTMLGILPGSFVYAYLGHTGATIDSVEEGLDFRIITALMLLAALSLIPVLYKKIKAKKEGSA